MFKNTDSQKVAVFAWDNANSEAKTGDAANITAQISKDGGATAATNDVNPTELDSADAPGIYIFDMTQAETNADLVVISPVSSTTDIVLRPVIIYTQTVMRGTDSAALAATALTDATWTDAKAGYLDAAISDRAPASEYDTEMARITADVATEAKQDIIDTNVDSILADTNELQTDDYPTLIAALPTAAEIKTAIEAAGSHLALIKAVTDSLPNAGALTDIDTGVNNLESRLTVVRAGYLDELAAANLPADIDTLLTRLSVANTQAIADWIDGGRLDLLLDAIPTTAMRGTDNAATETKQDIIDTVVDAIKAKTDNLPSGVPKNVALSNFEFLMISSTDHVSAKLGLVVTAVISKDGGAFAACTNAVSEISNGVYKINLTQAEMNADTITIMFTAVGADQTTITIITSN